MNKYLLLRDNKQSGPYSVNELALHGLKPYDLVWLEGRSAAWRYPSEIDELKPFAPVVEEQPFDRFYKKPEPKTFESAAKDNTRVQPKHFFAGDEIKKRQPGVQPVNPAKKIHVSLPNVKPGEPSAPEISNKNTDRDFTASEPPILETIKPILQPVSGPELYYTNARNKHKISEENSEAAYAKTKQADPVSQTSSINQPPVNKLLFRAVAAVCLLLGGALIGLIINYNSQQKKFQQLNQLVQEIRHKENPGATGSVKKESISEEVTKAKVKETAPPLDSIGQPAYKEDLQLPVEKKVRKDKKPVEDVNVGIVTDTQVKVPNTVPLINEEATQKANKLATELAKKNLWQLVSVDNNDYKTGVFGGISNLSLKLSNKSLYQLERVEVEIVYLSPENKTVNTQKVVFENVAAGEQLTINVPKSNRGVKIDYAIKKIGTKEFGLAHAGM
jgi:hypothetical protein